MRPDEAETLAVEALAWIAGEDGLMEVFLGSAGLEVADLRARAGDPDFLGAVLDFLLVSDAHVTGFCDSRGLPYEAPIRARQALPGGAVPDWT
ncbi:DUF3572 domain-containing protein [Maritimibacter sp. 55A14]|uniref:DUF3572 domain-containing protein n=1 Tax=Maritimibacter sp. 55A14 TaxID=2174844 RepID=UPI000D60A1B3|nr:DUF3572 domain-containing protein [Maritimibacter sp. 55A14]PWE29279.1 DUF3572 domain-containing protein [Maritimibacter sp. 55A14]